MTCRYEYIEDNQVKLNFRIKDTGIGLTDDEKSRLFKRFSQVKFPWNFREISANFLPSRDSYKFAGIFTEISQANSTTFIKYGGSGLGLKISKELVNMMGGDIDLESEKGVGSTFIFSVILTRGQVTFSHSND
jgi:two-component system, sensor histidine kinase and response regulator